MLTSEALGSVPSHYSKRTREPCVLAGGTPSEKVAGVRRHVSVAIAFRVVVASVTRLPQRSKGMSTLETLSLGSALVAVMQSTQASLGHHLTLCGRPSPSSRRLLLKAEMGSVLMIVGDIL